MWQRKKRNGSQDSYYSRLIATPALLRLPEANKKKQEIIAANSTYVTASDDAYSQLVEN